MPRNQSRRRVAGAAILVSAWCMGGLSVVHAEKAQDGASAPDESPPSAHPQGASRHAASPPGAPPPDASSARRQAANLGPYNVTFLEGGIGLTRPLDDAAPLLAADAPWSITAWVRLTLAPAGSVVIAAVGDCAGAEWRGLQLREGALSLALSRSAVIGATILEPGRWYAVAATYDGSTAHLYVDGEERGTATAHTAKVAARLELAPVSTKDTWAARAPAMASVAPLPHFGGSLALLTVAPAALGQQAVRALALERPDFSLITFNPIGVGWPWQEHAWRGLQEPQDPWTLPKPNNASDVLGVAGAPGTPGASSASIAPDAPRTASTPIARAAPGTPEAAGAPDASGAPGTASAPESEAARAQAAPNASVLESAPSAPGALRPERPDAWTLDAWHLNIAANVAGGGAQLSQADYREDHWYEAVVPGTVLTTLIARGVYPDPDYGLDNLAIPDTLCRQDYWYRTVFTAPAIAADREFTLTFKGINYAAEVWLNGQRLGSITGAFTRGTFDITRVLRRGRRNALAVRISPPPHPGIPHEQSVAAGPGNNGGNLAIDGPTFIASEGWDWIPGIRDRNTGIWQNVELLATGALRIRDPHVVTHLPLPRTDLADISISVPVENRRSAAVRATVTAQFDTIRVHKTVLLEPGITEVRLSPGEFPPLRVSNPRLWWPNGYGAANLYKLRLVVSTGGRTSDSTSVTFGIRELTYELSLFDHDGRLRRVEVDPTVGTALGQRLIDVRHEAIKRTPGGWAESLTSEGETSAGVRAATNELLTPYLVIKVNGVPIAARGGSWGMDDSRKRISRARLEPYFQLHREAHLNIIRNWLGQNTEEVFYDLADEYGLLVLNDFWISTQDFQVEPQDPALFLANARDVISRYRNHPSIAVWFGRNEGVPQPILNEGLADLVARLDGTRYYTGSSNAVNLQGSGPYNYRPPEQYFTELAQGFSVEVGTPSLSTLESLRASIPAADRWPLGDTYAYHDWHFGGNGDVATYMSTLAERYGAGSSLEDFERKAQLMDYESYRAIFEGFQASLWTRNSGRLLWMTHPSWPSNTWQIYSSDYDTAAAYYAVKKACEPLHAQLDLPTYLQSVVNITRTDQRQLRLRSRVLSLDNRVLIDQTTTLDAAANSVATLAPPLDLVPVLAREGLVIVKLTLTDAAGALLSDNVYWQGRGAASHRLLNDLAAQPVALAAQYRPRMPSSPGGDTWVDVMLTNRGTAPALNAKITVQDAHGARVLPIDYSDNYVTLLPGEARKIGVRCPAGSAPCARVALRGWNVLDQQIAVAHPQ